MIIKRREVIKLKKMKGWILIFGRRKTGKTFLVENFLDYDEYFFVKRDKMIVSKTDEKEINYDMFITLIKRGLREKKTIVVDEFHRLGDDFLDFLHHIEKEGKMILISSTLFLSSKLFSSHSPILGLFAEFPLGLISLEDVIKELMRFKMDKKTIVEMGILLREPLAVNFFDEKKSARKMLSEVILYSVRTVPALIGEIFIEEERTISGIYEGILRAVSDGKTVSSEISSYLFSKRLIKKDDPSLVQQYLVNLVRFGILKKIRVYNKKKFVYKHVSPLVRIFYYADEKYNISERTPSEAELERIVDEMMPKIIEDNIREFLAEKFGLEESVIEAKDFDVDACLLRFKKPEIVLEVKWKNKISEKEIDNAIENLKKINAKKMIFFVPDKNKIKMKRKEIEVVDILDFLKYN